MSTATVASELKMTKRRWEPGLASGSFSLGTEANCCEAVYRDGLWSRHEIGNRADFDRREIPEAEKPGAVRVPSLGTLLHWIEMVGWGVPSTVLIFLPKCPACLVAYIAFGIGIGVSVSATKYLRLLLVIPCLISLFWLTTSLAVPKTGNQCGGLPQTKRVVQKP